MSDRRNALRKYGYDIRGQPPQEHTLILRGKRYSAIGILSTEGVEDVYITDGTVDGDKFLEFVQQNLLPLLSGGFRNLERGVQPLAREAHLKIFWVATPLPVRKCTAGSPN